MFADDMILSRKSQATKKLLELISEFSKVTDYKVRMQKSIVFLYTSENLLEVAYFISYVPSISVPPARSKIFLLEIINESISCYSSRGTYDILVTKDNQTRSVGQYDNRGSFGELALMYNTPRAATIVATSEGSLWGLVS